MSQLNFETLLDRYADLIVSWGVNIQPGQTFYIHAEIAHRHFCGKLVKRAYEKGAKFVQVVFDAPEFLKHRLEHTLEESDLGYVPTWLPSRYHEIIDDQGASLRLIGPEDPDIFSKLDPKKVNIQQLSFRKTLKRYYEEGVGQSKVAWNVAAHATPAWGKKVFPHLSEQEAYEKLWEQIFKICRVDREDYIEEWDRHNADLKKRATYLDNLKIKALHFVGPGTDLKVYLSPKATFLGGTSFTQRKVQFEPNLPTEECFTTPDYRLTEGKAKVTRPVLVNGKLVEGLELVFEKGEITSFKAKEGEETFRQYIQCDEGAKRLGEVALVGCDSPIFQSNLIFQEILYDENAACHIAVGFAYTFCLKGGEKMEPEELASCGCNKSACHLDMMISNEEVDVFAETYTGESLPVIKKGYWIV